jgi:hypothetical protein
MSDGNGGAGLRGGLVMGTGLACVALGAAILSPQITAWARVSLHRCPQGAD